VPCNGELTGAIVRLFPSDGQTGSYSESEGSLGHCGLLSPGLSPYRTSAVPGLERYFRVARDPSRIDVKCRDHFLQADFPVLVRTMPNWITSESPTTRPDTYFAHPRRPWKARMALRYEIKASKYRFEVLCQVGRGRRYVGPVLPRSYSVQFRKNVEYLLNVQKGS
jgi:hypothetical protein